MLTPSAAVSPFLPRLLNAMSLETWLFFSFSSLGLLASPGPVVLFGILISMQMGVSAIPRILLGTVIGDAFAMSLALTGVGFALETLPLASAMMKIVGGLVLAFLAVQSLWVANEHLHASSKQPPAQALIMKSFSLTALHPGSYVFFAAFFPLFIEPDRNYSIQLVILGTSFLALAAITLGLWMLLGAKLSQQSRLGANLPRIRKAGSCWLLLLAAISVVTGVNEFLIS